MKHIAIVFSIIYLLFAGNCSAQQPTAQIHIGNGKVVLLLDESDAAKAIVHDEMDGYFEKITTSEMSIQMKQSLAPHPNREAMLPQYKAFLKSDVMDFTEDELKFLTTILQKMYNNVGEMNNAILPDTLKLIKTKGRHFGDGVWYTRENCIIIPANELAAAKAASFTGTMYHELFHVYSRLNPKKSAALYRLLGFESVGLDKLKLPDALAQRVLYNPDGVDFAQRIALTQEDKSVIQAIPIIYANNLGYKTGKDEFFGYVEFNLYPIEKIEGSDKWQVKVQEDGIKSPISVDSQRDFFRQVKDNTGYIIHPDELLADNFSFIMQERDGIKVSSKFSAEGKKLLSDIEEIIKAK